ncbi:MAG: nitroreductase family protein [Leptospiraceae bacterium]|nr:nitroreductase family protein [Leptospiraceae bacterium]
MINHEYKDHAVRITMNRPDVNAIDLNFVEEFHSVLDKIERQLRTTTLESPVFKTLTIESSIPEYFSFGFDLPTLAKSDYHYIHRMLTGYLELIRRLILWPIPVIALIEGRCIAGGMVLALGADYRIAAGNKCRFMLNEVNLNIPFPRGVVELVEGICGSVRTRELLTSGKSLRSEDALSIGLIDEFVTQEKSKERLENRIKYFASRPSFGFQKLKEARMEKIALTFAMDLRREKIDELLTDITSKETKQKISKLLGRLDRLGIETASANATLKNSQTEKTQESFQKASGIESLLTALSNRKSVRAFLADPVPQEIINKILDAAKRSPSSKNTQPYGVAITTLKERGKLTNAFIENYRKGVKPSPDFSNGTQTSEMKKHSATLGKNYYEWLGIERKDSKARAEIWEKNYRFWDAPEALFLFTNSQAGNAEILDAGIFLGFLLAAIEAEGLGSIPQASLVEYPDIVREILGLPKNAILLTGVSFGYPDPNAKINQFHTTRRTTQEIMERKIR